MKVFIELYASLMHLLPPGQGRFRREIQVESPTVVQQIIEKFAIPEEQAHIVLVNGILFVAMLEKNTNITRVAG